MPTTTAVSAPATLSASSNINDVQQLQRWAQHADVTFQEINKSLARITNLLNQVIALNNLKSKP